MPRHVNDVLRMNGINPIVEREKDDFYSTDPSAIDYLLKYESFNTHIWECACGNGNLTHKLQEHGYNVISSDIVDRGCPDTIIMDFLNTDKPVGGGELAMDIITNPPYSLVTEFVEKAYELTTRKVAMFLKIQFLETIKRYEHIFKKIPPRNVYIFVKRMPCYKNDNRQQKQSAVCYTWIVWDKEYTGDTYVRWIPNHEF